MTHDFKLEKVSGTVTVINDGLTFTTYKKFADEAGYPRSGIDRL